MQVIYHKFYDWSVPPTNGLFGHCYWDEFHVIGDKGSILLEDAEAACRCTVVFPQAQLNFAENLLRYRDDRPALVVTNEHGQRREISYAELYRENRSVSGVVCALSALAQVIVSPACYRIASKPSLPC